MDKIFQTLKSTFQTAKSTFQTIRKGIPALFKNREVSILDKMSLFSLLLVSLPEALLVTLLGFQLATRTIFHKLHTTSKMVLGHNCG